MLLAFVLLALAAGHPDVVLVAQALAGKAAAGRLLTARLLPVIHARCRVFLARRASGRLGAKDADDLAQEVWLALLANDGHALRAYDPERGMSLEGYVGLLSRRQLWRNVDALQAQKRGPGAELHDAEAAGRVAAVGDPEAHVLGQELAAALHGHLEAELPTRGRLVLAALYEDGHDAEQVAGLLGVSRQVIYNWQQRIRALARRFLAEHA
ncbi:MAG: sigma-70 family RNA polymerase sigma factor [Myxococcales bacterium]|nr:sigma-70 family RNA polymerase sigma factor [Myxococcales bacterium]